MQLMLTSRMSRFGASTAESARQGARLAWQGIVEIGHNSLAVLGLACIGLVLFFSGDSALRLQIERQALEWLNLRHGVVSSQAESPVDLLADLSEPGAVGRATASSLAALPRPQALVANWIARRYRVAPEPMARLVQEAWAVGRKANLDPTLILAIMAIESSFNPFAQSPVGAQGLMQVMTHVHDDKYASFGGRLAAFDPITNVRVGVQVLTECIARAGSLEGGLKYYVGAANLPDDGGYAERVLVEQGYLKAVSEGQQIPLTAPSVRPGSTPAPTPSPPLVTAAAPTMLPASLSTPVTAMVQSAPAAISGISLPGNPLAGLLGGPSKPVAASPTGAGAVMAPALGAPSPANLSATQASSTSAAAVPAAVPAVDKAPSAAVNPGAPAHAAQAATATAPAPHASAHSASLVTAPAAPAAPPTLAKPVAPQPAASSAADAEPRPAAKPKTETAAAPAVAAVEARVALVGGAAR
jgi:Transglycosylase SLT domain